MALETELDTFRENFPRLITGNEGKFVLIHEKTVVDTYGTYEDAIKEGYNRFGLKPFLVKQLQAFEQVQFITRLIDCHTSHVNLHPAG